MGLVITILLLALMVGAGIFLIKYSRTLTTIVDYSNATGISVFGNQYRNAYQLMSDTSFLNHLWVKNCHKEIEDSQLSNLVAKAHSMLRFGISVGLLIFSVMLINAMVTISA